MRTKTTILLLIMFCALSCKKECTIPTTIDNVKGKIKSLLLYNSDTTFNISRFYFNYDSLSGTLISVDANIKFQGIDTYFLGYINIINQSNNYIKIYNNINNVQYTIHTDNKQITDIYKMNNGISQLATSVYINNGMIDSIYDIGDFLQTNISFSNFKFHEGNCLSYSTSWKEFNGIEYIEKSDSIRLTYYNSIENNNVLFNQIIGSEFGGGSVFNEIIYFLGINGYYISKPNKNLIETIIHTNNLSTKYNYSIIDNNIKEVKIYKMDNNINDTSYQNITYY